MAIEPRPNKKHGTVYRVRVLDPVEKWYPSRTFVSKKEARFWEQNLLQLARQGVSALPESRKKTTLNDYWMFWSKECRSRASEGWKLSQNQMFAKYIAPTLGAMKVTAIKPRDVRSILNEIESKGYSPQTRLHVFNLLHKMFEDALDEEDSWIASNPVRKKFRPKVPIRERSFLHPDDARRLLEAAKGDYLEPLIWIGVFVGLRSEALLPLRVERVDLQRREILIAECYKRRVGRIEDMPKGGRQEYVPIPQVLVDYLEPILRGKKPGDFVVNGQRNEMVSYGALLDGVARLCAKAGVKRITPHEMRHTTSEIWYECGASEEDVRRLLNQKSSSTTKRYIHRSDERLKGIAKLIGVTASTTTTPPEPQPPVQVAPEPGGVSEGAKIIPLRLRRV